MSLGTKFGEVNKGIEGNGIKGIEGNGQPAAAQKGIAEIGLRAA